MQTAKQAWVIFLEEATEKGKDFVSIVWMGRRFTAIEGFKRREEDRG
jgi:hypothetical protein